MHCVFERDVDADTAIGSHRMDRVAQERDALCSNRAERPVIDTIRDYETGMIDYGFGDPNLL
jgi:hypothetical protein